ncbi:MAG: hypothetical protein HY303_12755 [Candidatus Wallbacteria bacterium]|nr:hypothetical protein [Candidatus Wallbacteria bacterium]
MTGTSAADVWTCGECGSKNFKNMPACWLCNASGQSAPRRVRAKAAPSAIHQETVWEQTISLRFVVGVGALVAFGASALSGPVFLLGLLLLPMLVVAIYTPSPDRADAKETAIKAIEAFGFFTMTLAATLALLAGALFVLLWTVCGGIK